MLWKIYISPISFHNDMAVKSVICFFRVGGMNFWWTLGGPRELIYTFLALFFFFLEFLLWWLVKVSSMMHCFRGIQGLHQWKTKKQSTRLAGLTYDFRNTNHCFSWIYFFFHSSKLSFIQLLQTEMNRRTAITSLLH